MGVAFDLDETLLDRKGSLDVYARQLYSEMAPGDLPLDRFLEAFQRLDADGKTPRDTFFALLASELLTGRSPRDLGRHFEANAWQSPRLFAGVSDMLRQLRGQGVRLGIITNGSEVSQLAKIHNSGLSELVHSFVVSGSFGARKPHRSIFDHMAVELGIDPGESWFVGDDPYADVWGSKQCGYRAVWVERSAWPTELTPCYDARIDSVLETLDIVVPSNNRWSGP
jgi:putative hydrolase of the HAD superfamily